MKRSLIRLSLGLCALLAAPAFAVPTMPAGPIHVRPPVIDRIAVPPAKTAKTAAALVKPAAYAEQAQEKRWNCAYNADTAFPERMRVQGIQAFCYTLHREQGKGYVCAVMILPDFDVLLTLSMADHGKIPGTDFLLQSSLVHTGILVNQSWYGPEGSLTGAGQEDFLASECQALLPGLDIEVQKAFQGAFSVGAP